MSQISFLDSSSITIMFLITRYFSMFNKSNIKLYLMNPQQILR